jgi:hypothetical protein
MEKIFRGGWVSYRCKAQVKKNNLDIIEKKLSLQRFGDMKSFIWGCLFQSLTPVAFCFALRFNCSNLHFRTPVKATSQILV